MKRPALGRAPLVGRLGLLGSLVRCCGGCLPPVTGVPSAGMFSLRPRSPGAVDLGLQGRFVMPSEEGYGGGAALHVEPFLTSRLSLPVSLTAMSPLYAGGRVGPRFRIGERFALGVGGTFAPAFIRDDDCPEDGPCSGTLRTAWASGLDLEVSAGRRWDWFELTWSTRLLCLWVGEYGVAPGEAPIGGFSMEVSLAFHVHRALALVVGLQGYLLAPYGGDAGPGIVFSGTLNFRLFWQIGR